MNRNSEHRKDQTPLTPQDAKRPPASRFHNRPELIETGDGVTGGRRWVAASLKLLKPENLPFVILFSLAAASLLSRLWLILQ